jgi:hypothetical protein
MNYSADKLAAIFGCTVTGIMDINREIQRMHHVLEIPELVANIMRYIPNDCFNPRFNLYPLWWAVAERELGERHKKAEEAHKKSMSDIQAYIMKIGLCWIGGCEIEQEKKSYELMKQNMFKLFHELANVDKAILQCGFKVKDVAQSELIRNVECREMDTHPLALLLEMREIGLWGEEDEEQASQWFMA